MSKQAIVSVPRFAPFFTPIFVAVDKGFLAEEGIEGKVVTPTGIERLLAGEVDFMFGSPSRGYFLRESGAKLICGHSTRESSHVLMVRPEIEHASQLEHILLSGADGTGGSRMVNELKNILALNDVQLEASSIEIQGVEGSHKEQWQMLQEGIGDAATLGAPWWIFAAQKGYRNLGHEQSFTMSASGSGLYTRPHTIESDPDLVGAVVRAYVRAMRYCVENVEGTIETMMKYSREWGVDSREIALAAHQDVSPYWRVELDLDAIRELMEKTAVKEGRPALSLDEVSDLQFLNGALKALG
ncbi:MAG TPA: ABC transporter substrate-binding protein [Chloroflexota bacterium]